MDNSNTYDFKCDICGAVEEVKHNSDLLDEVRKLRDKGWVLRKGVNCCPECSEKPINNTKFDE